MNKKEIRSAINKAAYAFAESMGYEMHDDEGDGTVLFAPVDYTSADDTITWHRSSHDTCVLNWSSYSPDRPLESIYVDRDTRGPSWGTC